MCVFFSFGIKKAGMKRAHNSSTKTRHRSRSPRDHHDNNAASSSSSSSTPIVVATRTSTPSKRTITTPQPAENTNEPDFDHNTDVYSSICDGDEQLDIDLVEDEDEHRALDEEDSSAGLHEHLDIEEAEEDDENLDEEHLLEEEGVVEDEDEDDEEEEETTILSEIDEDADEEDTTNDLLNTTASTKSTASRSLKSPRVKKRRVTPVDSKLQKVSAHASKRAGSGLVSKNSQQLGEQQAATHRTDFGALMQQHLSGGVGGGSTPRTPLYDFTLQALEMSLYGYLRQTDPLYVGHAISGIRMSQASTNHLLFNSNNNANCTTSNTTSAKSPMNSHSPQTRGNTLFFFVVVVVDIKLELGMCELGSYFSFRHGLVLKLGSKKLT